MMNKSCTVRECFVHNHGFAGNAQFHPLFGHTQSPGFSLGFYSLQ